MATLQEEAAKNVNILPQEVELWEPVQVEDIEIVPVPFHGEQDEPDAVIDHFTYVLRTKNLSVYAGVDSYRDTLGDMLPVLEKVREQYHPVMAFLPISKITAMSGWRKRLLPVPGYKLVG